jgi:uncharacterized protein (TIGR00269 family)
MVAARSKCRTCRGPAIIDLPRHNANFCAEHFMELCRRQVTKAIEHFKMIDRDDRLLVAVSGGKDSLAVWDLLLELGYRADGLYVGLGIGDYSDTSAGFARAFAADRELRLIEITLRDQYGYDIPTAAKATCRVPCSACGLSKRHVFDKAALEGGYDVLVTGHNLDDEAAVLFGNTLHWDVEYLARQLPVLQARPGFPRKVKPLVRLTERETAAWCIVRGIDYLVDECPMAAGNKHLAYKNALNVLEETSPGAKAGFYFNFIENMAPVLAGRAVADGREVDVCSNCGSPTTGSVCAFCRLVETASAHVPVPVDLVMKKRRGAR